MCIKIRGAAYSAIPHIKLCTCEDGCEYIMIEGLTELTSHTPGVQTY